MFEILADSSKIRKSHKKDEEAFGKAVTQVGLPFSFCKTCDAALTADAEASFSILRLRCLIIC